jgi:hypothetical protein
MPKDMDTAVIDMFWWVPRKRFRCGAEIITLEALERLEYSKFVFWWVATLVAGVRVDGSMNQALILAYLFAPLIDFERKVHMLNAFYPLVYLMNLNDTVYGACAVNVDILGQYFH